VAFQHSPVKRKARVGLLGAGFIAEFHVRALRAIPEIELVGVCDLAWDKAQSAGRKWQIANVYASLDEMLAGCRPDVVHVLLPPGAHADAVIQCANAGVNTFVEKPLALNSRDCEKILQVAHSTGCVVGVNHNQAWHPAVVNAAGEIANRRLGRIEHVSTFLAAPLRQLSARQHGHWMFREPGNIILEQAPHPLSQITRLLGPVREVSCLPSGRQTLSTGAVFFDTWQISLICERGPAQMLLAFGRDHLEFSLQIIGQDATAQLDLRRNVVVYHDKSRFLEPVEYVLDGLRMARNVARQSSRNFVDYCLGFVKLRPPSDAFSLGMTTSIQQFYAAFLSGAPVPVGSSEGLAVVRACEEIVEAARIHWAETESERSQNAVR
jgi:2-alkyl-3-oxoalkanoate reductase